MSVSRTVGENDRITFSIKQVKKPDWVERTPQTPHYHYAIGASPLYFYEASCWRKAEEIAFRNLGRTVLVDIMAMQKQAQQGQEIRDEQIEITLHNVQIVARYVDPDTRIHYVLMRMKK